ncbi:carbonic anhydrase [Hymenobacter daecheongensis DSM 21074]|uniref:Carbonic anhydrase n=1 Tax=Hymenobacter daecheongensis DSM 21074 TaxID=1121955 RepID=A0A1M6API3_9BACT|nr:carbonic anhydrase [Hymenobacter daecheongensis]SHI38414.1 carbonic anhydrase [Hymenobacter daecheongensis DSM 21074]
MIRNKVLLLLALVGWLSTTAQAQTRRPAGRPAKAAKAASLDSPQWRTEHYIVDRDSAYANPHVALRNLVGGNRRFVENKSIRPRQDQATLTKTEKGQKPFATIVGCSDSRVPNEIIFDQGVGDLFIVRTAGQVMAAASYGSIEFASWALGAKLIVVLGHQSCGAVSAAINRPDVPGHIITLVNSIKPAAEKTKTMPGDRLDNTIRQNVLDQVNELRDLEPVLAKKYRDGEILIVGAVYNLGTGKVEFLPETMQNLPVSRASAAPTKPATK